MPPQAARPVQPAKDAPPAALSQKMKYVYSLS